MTDFLTAPIVVVFFQGLTDGLKERQTTKVFKTFVVYSLSKTLRCTRKDGRHLEVVPIFPDKE